MQFIKDNWLWIVTPVVIVLAFLIVLLMLTDSGPSDDFTYTLN